MTTSYWVIREGMVHGQGRYFGSEGNDVWEDLCGDAAMYQEIGEYSPALDDLACLRQSGDCRLVRVTRKPKDNAAVLFAVARNARLLALADAEQACRDVERVYIAVNALTVAGGARKCVTAIAALKGGAK